MGLLDSRQNKKPYLIFDGTNPPLITLVRDFALISYYQTEAISNGDRAGAATVVRGNLANHGLITLINAVLNPAPFIATAVDPLDVLMNVLPTNSNGPIILSMVFNQSHHRIPDGFERIELPNHKHPEHCIFFKSANLKTLSSKVINHGFGIIGILSQKRDPNDEEKKTHKNSDISNAIVPGKLPTDLPVISSSVVPERFRHPEAAVPELFSLIDDTTQLCLDLNDSNGTSIGKVRTRAMQLLMQLSNTAFRWVKTLKSLLWKSTDFMSSN